MALKSMNLCLSVFPDQGQRLALCGLGRLIYVLQPRQCLRYIAELGLFPLNIGKSVRKRDHSRTFGGIVFVLHSSILWATEYMKNTDIIFPFTPDVFLFGLFPRIALMEFYEDLCNHIICEKMQPIYS